MSAVSGEAPRSGRYPVLAKYDVLEELGHGGMATVYRAHDRRLGRDVAVKVIHPHLRDSGEVARRFSIEAQAVAKLRHANIVEVYDVSAEGEAEQYLVVELLRGRTLRKILQASGALPPEVAAAIGIELLGALGHAHAHGVIHRDVKPENVIIEHRKQGSAESEGAREGGSSRQLGGEQAGDRVAVKLTDFGIAKLLDVQGMTSTGQVLGSPAHMAPEQIEGQDVDARSDVFGMGVLLYECMVGHLPFEGNNPAQVLRRVLDGVYPSAERERPTIGRVWSQMLDKALGRTPVERYEDAGAMRDALAAELARVGVTNPRAELEAYSDDPEGYTARRDKALIALLCERALAARKRGDALAAAADYNRALAYAPHDPALLRIVASLHGAEARMRFVRRAGPLLAGTILLGAAAFLVTRELRSTRVELHPDPDPSYTAAGITPPTTGSTDTTGTAAAAAGGTTTTPTKTATPIGIATPTATSTDSTTGAGAAAQSTVKPAIPKGARDVKFSNVFPPNIVRLSIDDRLVLKELSADKSFTFTTDDKPHVLRFDCEGDYCVASVTRLAPGAAPTSPLPVNLAFKTATLNLTCNANSTYAFDDDIRHKLHAGDNNVELTGAPTKQVTVREYPSNLPRSIRLAAGQTRALDFTASSSP